MIRSEHGFTLPELLIAATLMVVVMLATLATFDQFNSNARTNQRQNDIIEEARAGSDQLARELRNLANPTTQGSTIDTASGYDFIFQTSDPSKRWVRYCLAGSPSNGRLHYATSADTTLTSDMKASACPGNGWAKARVVTANVVNKIGGQDRPVFSYACSTPLAPTQACPLGDPSKITLARTDLFIDVNPGRAPAERRVSSGVYLRNQNEPPTASFTAVGQTTPPRSVLLNASASDDPEGRTLHYYWWKGAGTAGTAPTDSCLPAVTPTATFLGEGVTLSYEFPQGDGSSQTITLVVKDAGCLAASSSKVVQIP